MAFLQICRRQQVLLEAGVAARRFLTTRTLSTSCKLCCQGGSGVLKFGSNRKCVYGFLEPAQVQGKQPSIRFLASCTSALQQKAAKTVPDASSAGSGHSATSGKTKKTVGTKNGKKKTGGQNEETAKVSNKTNSDKTTGKLTANAMNKKRSPVTKSSLDGSIVKDNAQTTVDSGKKGKGKTKSVKKKANESGKRTTNLQASTNSDSMAKNVIENDFRNINLSKEVTSLSTVTLSCGSDEHSLDYSPEAVLAETADEHYGDSELEGMHLPDAKMESVVTGDHDIAPNILDNGSDVHMDYFLHESNEERHEEESTAILDDVNIPSLRQFGATVQTPKKYMEGTAGGKLFKAQTLAEIDGYLYLGKPNEAEKLFNRYLRMGKTFEVDTFNKLLHGWAQKGNVMSVRLLHNLLKKEGLEPDMETYAALLHAYGKFGDADRVRNLLDEMGEKQIDPKHIFHNCDLTEPQAKQVLNALKLVKPHYQPEIPSAQRQISYPSLVASLYSDKGYSDAELASMPGKLEEELNENMLQNLLDEQISRELAGATMVKSVEEEQLDGNEHKKRKEMFYECRETWRKALIESIEKEFVEMKNSKGNSVHTRYAPFFQAFEPDELADITLDTIVFYVKGRVEGVPLNGVSGVLGCALNTKYIVKHRVKSGMLDKMKEIYYDYFSYLMDEKVTARKMVREFWNELDDTLPYGASLQQEVPIWPWATKIVFGCSLVDCFLKSATINVNLFNNRQEKILPAFYHTYEFKVNKKFGVLKPHPIVCKLFKGYLASQGEISMETTSLPMLVPPRPWRATKDGAYLILPVELIRCAGDEDGRYDRLLEEKTNKHDLVSVFDSLNFLGACAWKTNKRILDIAVQLFNSGGNEDLTIPGPVQQPKVDYKAFKSTTDPDERKKQVRERRIAKKLAREQYSLRMSALYKLSVANHFRDHVFWLPINLDFRGRVYPIPPHCAHVGDDLSRGMLQFAKGAPLGESGLEWLKIHLVTLHGAQKKASLKERLEFADKMIHEILDSADNPLTGRCWWKTADDPWQTLATCMEIADALRSPDPTQFISHQPVHQDGSCNGLQHYAALGRDSYGAKQVNLMPADRPQDVYEEVAKLVEATRLRDAEAGHEIAKDLEGKVSRKVVKQTVMTIVYGVTFVGGRLQIERQLKDLDMDEKSVFKASTYLVTKVFASIGEMFTAARAIQNWFASASTQIALSGHFVDWYTPLGLYVCQPYSRKAPTKVVKTKLQWMLINAKGLPNIPPDSRKQRGAFPPNFVHSLDSTHMMLTALFCQRSGTTFSSVHDSFWTHAANVDVMNRVCREQFVALHSEPILEELQKHFEKNYSNLKLTRPLKSKETGEERTHVSFEGRPEHGDFVIQQVLDSTYFFC